MVGSSEAPLHPQTRRHLRNEERLRQAAIQEFALHGLHGAKVSSIVAQAELSQPSFYRVWPSKEAAYNDILKQTNDLWREAASQSLNLGQDGPLEVMLERGVQQFFEALTQDLNLTRLVLAHNSRTEQHSFYVAIYRKRFEALFERGQIHSELPAEVLGQVYSALIERFLFSRLLELEWTPKLVARELTTVLLHLLTP